MSTPPNTPVRKFNMLDKLGYTLGDLGCCCTEQFRAMYLTVFYTLILKVNPVHIGILMLITKIWDAVNDPIIGPQGQVHPLDPGLLLPHGRAVRAGLCECEQPGLRSAAGLHVHHLCAV